MKRKSILNAIFEFKNSFQKYFSIVYSRKTFIDGDMWISISSFKT